MAEKGDTAVAVVDTHKMDGLMPVSFSDKLKLADVLAKSGLCPKSLDTAAKVFVALQMGHEWGLSPMSAVNAITAINGRAVPSADLMLALARRHPDFAGVSIESSPTGCKVVIRRRTGDSVDTFTSLFAEEDAKRAGLSGKSGPWTQYPARMYRARALAYACRDAFPDVLAGLMAAEEARDIEPEMRSVAAEIGPNPDDPVPVARADIVANVKASSLPDERKAALIASLSGITSMAVLEKMGAKIEAEIGPVVRAVPPESTPAPDDPEQLGMF